MFKENTPTILKSQISTQPHHFSVPFNFFCLFSFFLFFLGQLFLQAGENVLSYWIFTFWKAALHLYSKARFLFPSEQETEKEMTFTAAILKKNLFKGC